MRRAFLFILFIWCLPAAAMAANTYRVLCYHDVQEDVRVSPDPYAVDTAQLVAQFAWLKENGFHMISLDDVIAAREGRRILPDKALLLTFDDGYRSVYTRVFPLLKLFNYPAVVALSGHWLDAPAGKPVEYEGKEVPRSRFLSWEQIAEMAASGLVEIASHSYDLHRGIPANPQGNLTPSAVTYRFDPGNGYEDEHAHASRIRTDLARNSALIKAKTGRAPRVMVWPYGHDSGQAIEIAQRVVHVDLDYVYDADPGRQRTNIDRLLDRIRALRVTTVYLQAFADPDGNGQADAVYFPNRHLPMRADLFSHVAWQLSTRALVKVYAWMPVLAFELPSKNAAAELTVHSSDPAAPASGSRYRRLTPFSTEVRDIVGEIYEDLARHALFDGLLFHDDATLDDFEDASPAAQQTYDGWGLPASIDTIRADPALLERWTQRKTETLIAFTGELAQRVRRYQGSIRTARNLYARPVMEPRAEARFAQSLPDFLAAYDYAALMAMPVLEGEASPDTWFETLVRKVAAQPGGLTKTVFELQSIDWTTRKPVPATELAAQMQRLQRLGALNLGYYPDDFVADRPALAAIKPALSLQNFPRKD